MKPLSIAFLHFISLFFYSSNLSAQPAIDDKNSPVEFGCQFHATAYFNQPSQTNMVLSTSDYLDLMTEAQELESQLIQLDITNEVWTEERGKVLMNLAQLKQSVGDTAEARELYENALYNMRINGGIYTLDQLPVILDLMAWYMAEDDEFTDQLGDRAAFLYEKTYTEDEQILDLVMGYRKLLELRLNAHYSHDRNESAHSIKAAELGRKISRLMDKLSTSVDPAVRNQVLSKTGFYTRYDDLGRAVETPEGGVDQVSRSTGVILDEVQSLLRPPDPETQADYDRAKQLLDELHESYDELRHVDRAALLDFYADYSLAKGDTPETISHFENILSIRVLRPDYQLRALRALGQLYESEERWSESIDSYNCWRQLSTKEDSRVFIGLANAYRRLEENELAIHHLLKYMELLDREGQIADEYLYAILKEMYYEIEDFSAGAEVTRTMSALFE